MSFISRLEFARLRNFDRVSVSPTESVNLLVGPNGSGKSSFLEAIHLLALGRSFRSTKLSPLISHGEASCTAFAEIDGNLQLGFEKSLHKSPVIKFRGEKQRSWVEIARKLPVLLIDSSTFKLLEGGPKARRQFLDWNVFHVERQFIEAWRSNQRCLANRNQLIRQAASQKPDLTQLKSWDREFVRTAKLVTEFRQRTFELFQPVLAAVLGQIVGFDISGLTLSYYPGWNVDEPLEDLIHHGLQQDIRYGSTQRGPHRADLIVKVDASPASDILSRGQTKILVTALKLAQGCLLEELSDERCIYLVDDLASELDQENRQRVCRFLENRPGQCFITAIDRNSLDGGWMDPTKIKTFHVEHGKIAV